jgi:hypothetical protein
MQKGHEVEEPNISFIRLVADAHEVVVLVPPVLVCGHVGEGGALERDVRLVENAALSRVATQLLARKAKGCVRVVTMGVLCRERLHIRTQTRCGSGRARGSVSCRNPNARESGTGESDVHGRVAGRGSYASNAMCAWSRTGLCPVTRPNC